MDALSISAASGLRARMESLELLANNLANTGTDGYKSDQPFYSLYIAPEASPGADTDAATLPVIERRWTDFAQGTLQATDNPADLALSGKGFFAVNGPSGPLYTRNGSFNISAAGRLLTTDGYPVRTVGGGILQVDPGKALEISRDGSVRQGGQPVGQLELVDFESPLALAKVGNSYFRNPDPKLQPVPAAVEVHQGRLENSNTNPAESAVRLIGVMRQFEMLQKAVSLGMEMNRKTIDEVARVGS